MQRFMQLRMPVVSFAQQFLLSVYTEAQIGSFSLTPAAVPDMPPQLEGVIMVVRDLGFAQLSYSL